MIHGEGISGKYNVIVSGRKAELWAGASVAELEQKREQLWEFIQMIRSCTHEEFEQWYQLYA